MVYLGNQKIGTLPVNIEKSTVYSFPCDAVENLVKIVTGRTDKKLAFAKVEAFGDPTEYTAADGLVVQDHLQYPHMK